MDNQRPQIRRQPTAQSPAAAPPHPAPRPVHPPHRRKRWSAKVIAGSVLAILVVLVLAKLFLFNLFGPMHDVKRGQYQAVFLTNNQLYFGKIKQIDRDSIRLESIYYFQNQQTGQNQDPKQLSLNKLGNELHGPEDVMFIERRQVIFWENLKDDSKVVQAIKTQTQ